MFPTKSKSKEFCVGRGVFEPVDRVGRGVSTLIISIEGSGVPRDDGTGVFSAADGIGDWILDEFGDSVSVYSTSLLSGRYSAGTSSPRKIL